MDSQEKSIEIKCNKFAAELLVPEELFRTEISNLESVDYNLIEKLAEKYSVSREVILRRLLDYDLVTKDYYQNKTTEWNKDYLRTKPKKPGGNYYLTRLSYLGQGFTTLVFQNHHQGILNKAQLAHYLNIKARNVDKLESHLNW